MDAAEANLATSVALPLLGIADVAGTPCTGRRRGGHCPPLDYPLNSSGNDYPHADVEHQDLDRVMEVNPSLLGHQSLYLGTRDVSG
ncbi:GM26666 [Drosophila sechellia]|uniref:GM26666 n=1 Tax=Drosophila sechellia TaxID=7238 RepID=B4IM64_DROSE|nr:GM26666 [Drosophila sechellia]